MTPEGSTWPPDQPSPRRGPATGPGQQPEDAAHATPNASLAASATPAGALPAPEAPAGALPPPMERFAARPAKLPMPTYWPFFLAMGIAFIAWGLIATWVLTAGGLIVFIISLIGWINILRHEHE